MEQQQAKGFHLLVATLRAILHSLYQCRQLWVFRFHHLRYVIEHMDAIAQYLVAHNDWCVGIYIHIHLCGQGVGAEDVGGHPGARLRVELWEEDAPLVARHVYIEHDAVNVGGVGGVQRDIEGEFGGAIEGVAIWLATVGLKVEINRLLRM